MAKICAHPEFWKKYNSGRREYHLYKSCQFDPAPGEPAPPTEGNLPPCLTVTIFAHELISVEERQEEKRVGNISILASRDDWKAMAHLNNDVESNNQLERAAESAGSRNWEVEPLTRMLNLGFDEIQRQIRTHEDAGAEILGEFPLR